MYLYGAIFFAMFLSAFANGPVPSCTNDFLETMTCNLNSHTSFNCTRYTLIFVSEDKRYPEKYRCNFINNARGLCECTVQMPKFISLERYHLKLWEGEKSIYSDIIEPGQNVKPLPPEKVSVKPEVNGNYRITWKINYTSDSYLWDSLRYQLTYKKEGDADKGARIFNTSQRIVVIPQNKLEKDAVYVAKVRAYSENYAGQFSDWSPDVTWTTSSSDVSVERLLKIVVPILCVLLIVTLFFLYWCILKVKEKWWNTIPNPFVKPLIPGNGKVQVFIPIQKSESFNQKIDIIENTDKSRKTLLVRGVSTDEDMCPKTHLHSGQSLKSEYARTYSLPEEKIISGTLMQSFFEEAFRNLVFNPHARLPEVTSPTTESLYKNTEVVTAKDSGIGLLGNKHLQSQGSSGSSGSYKNISYSWISTLQGSNNQELVMREKSSCSSQTPLNSNTTDDYQSYDSEELKVPGQLSPPGNDLSGLPCSSIIPGLSPLILTDLDYQSCNSSATPEAEHTPSTCSSMADSDLEMSPPFIKVHKVDNGYQSFTDAIGKTSVEGANLPSKWSSRTSLDDNDIHENMLICSINPAYTGLPSLKLCKEAHHVHKGLAASSSEQWPGMDASGGERIGHKWLVPQLPQLPTTTSVTLQNRQMTTLEKPAHFSANSPSVMQIINDSSYHKV